MVSWDVYLVGIISLPVSCLGFPPPNDKDHLGRLEDKRLALRLAKHFENVGVKPSEQANQIKGIINSRTYQYIRDQLSLSKEQLRQTVFEKQYPFLKGGCFISCHNGRHRVEAAKLLMGDKASWTIRLHYFPQETLDKTTLAYKEPIEHASEKACSDGEKCRNAIMHLLQNRPTLSGEWENVFPESDSKKKCLAAFLGNPDILEAVRLLLPFPGLWAGLQLSNWLKHLATRCDELIIMYWRHIYTVWNNIVGGREDLRQLVDIDTVRYLQYRAPVGSSADRDEIHRLLADRSLFRHISSESDRNLVVHNILSTTVIIPSIESFHKNMAYIAIGAKILKTHLQVEHSQPDEHLQHVRNESVTNFSDIKIQRATLFKNFFACWRNDQVPVIQVTETQFETWQGRASPVLAYIELFVCALRNFFPSLSTETPLRDTRGEAVCGLMNGAHIKRLRWQAWKLGFRSTRINTESQLNPEMEDKPQVFCSLSEWRGGKPYFRTFLDLKRNAFLKTLFQDKEPFTVLTPAFVLRDMINAFFGDISHLMQGLESNGQPRDQPDIPMTDAPCQGTDTQPDIPDLPCQDAEEDQNIAASQSAPQKKEQVPRHMTQNLKKRPVSSLSHKSDRKDVKRRRPNSPPIEIEKLSDRAIAQRDARQRRIMYDTERFLRLLPRNINKKNAKPYIKQKDVNRQHLNSPPMERQRRLSDHSLRQQDAKQRRFKSDTERSPIPSTRSINKRKRPVSQAYTNQKEAKRRRLNPSPIKRRLSDHSIRQYDAKQQRLNTNIPLFSQTGLGSQHFSPDTNGRLSSQEPVVDQWESELRLFSDSDTIEAQSPTTNPALLLIEEETQADQGVFIERETPGETLQYQQDIPHREDTSKMDATVQDIDVTPNPLLRRQKEEKQKRKLNNFLRQKDRKVVPTLVPLRAAFNNNKKRPLSQEAIYAKTKRQKTKAIENQGQSPREQLMEERQLDSDATQKPMVNPALGLIDAETQADQGVFIDRETPGEILTALASEAPRGGPSSTDQVQQEEVLEDIPLTPAGETPANQLASENGSLPRGEKRKRSDSDGERERYEYKVTEPFWDQRDLGTVSPIGITLQNYQRVGVPIVPESDNESARSI